MPYDGHFWIIGAPWLSARSVGLLPRVASLCPSRCRASAAPNHLRTELVLQALDMAIYRRRPERVLHHSDQGTQYTSIAFGLRCKEAGVRPSIGSVGDCYDNAMCESFFATLECELLDRRRFKTQHQAALEVFDFIEGWYNSHRRHSALGHVSPNAYERRMVQAA